jgi:hypothetical protein
VRLKYELLALNMSQSQLTMSDHILWVTGLACTILSQFQEQLHQTTKADFDKL